MPQLANNPPLLPYLSNLPSKQALLDAFLQRPISELRTPAFVIDRAIVRRNCVEMLQGAKDSGMAFRAHVKTHKTTEGIRLELSPTSDIGDQATPLKCHAIIVSTLIEAWEVLRSGLVEDGTVNDILYGLPLPVAKIAEIHSLQTQLASKGAKMRLLVDHPIQAEALKAYTESLGDAEGPRWSVFVKVDAGYKRAGIPPSAPIFTSLIKQLLSCSSFISIYGFYCHAGNSYSSKSLPEATNYYSSEIDTVVEAAHIAKSLDDATSTSTSTSYVLSVGSTPTAHASAKLLSMEVSGTLELHAGNYIFHDLQQLATSLIAPRDIAHRIIASVISLYPGRGVIDTSREIVEGENEVDEAMVDVGGIVMSKDTGPIKGWGKVVGLVKTGAVTEGGLHSDANWLLDESTGWTLSRISQEHGILSNDRTSLVGAKVVSDSVKLEIGDKVAIIGQHACLIASSHPWYYIVDSDLAVDEYDQKRRGERVVDVWVPWKGW
ncbi:hypothetical protein FRB95_001518 [Tulasnella sp. JGI-2019a]|nr:hypothetical protein FRB95_001518 [Tulasnella sp. JGI-2019a]